MAKEYISVDVDSRGSGQQVKLTSTNNEFTGQIKIPTGGQTKNIKEVFISSVRVDGQPVTPTVDQSTGLRTVDVPSSRIKSITLKGAGDSKIDAVVDDNGNASIQLDGLDMSTMYVKNLYVDGQRIQDLVSGQTAANLENIDYLNVDNGVTINQIVDKVNEILAALKGEEPPTWGSDDDSDVDSGDVPEPADPNGKVLYKTSADGEWLQSDADITDGVFSGFTEKESAVAVIIPSKDTNGNDVTSIGNEAFSGCTSLTSVTIPDSMTSIGSWAFMDCSDSLFDTTMITGVKLVDGWAIKYTNAISSNLDLTGIRGIANGAFMGCQIASVTIPDTVTNIGPWAFNGCSLTSITIPNSVTSIGDNVFGFCFSLMSVTIPDSVTSIGEGAFDDCSGLTSVTITANGGNAETVKQMVIDAINDTSISDNITWNMPNQ